MATYQILKICNVCGGDGLRPNLVGGSWQNAICSRCDGAGKYLFGIIDSIVGIESTPPPSHFVVKNLYVNSITGKLEIDYDDTPVE